MPPLVEYVFNQRKIKGKVKIMSGGLTGLKDTQTRYSIYDLELAAIVFACPKLRGFMCQGLQSTVFTGCRPLKNFQKTDLSMIAFLWILRSMKFVLANNKKGIKGIENGMEDYLSRICQKTEEVGLWPNFDTIFKGTLSRSIQGAGMNSQYYEAN